MGRSDAGTDAYAAGPAEEQPEHTVAVSAFSLDKFEVSVGRFRKFVDAYPGSKPSAGAGAHPVIGAPSGWQAAWDVNLPVDRAALVASVKCSAATQTWTDAPGADEARAMNCLSWYVAFAFCSWDGGRLPTEAEWEYAAAGGSENRLYPWGGTAPTCAHANFEGCPFNVNFVGSPGAGIGLFGHADLAGNVLEWALDWHDLDWYANPAATGTDVANLTTAASRILRGGYYGSTAPLIRAADRGYLSPGTRFGNVGVRCAR
jgi:formylglycine-generating enzyme required for sulfatase activity